MLKRKRIITSILVVVLITLLGQGRSTSASEMEIDVGIEFSSNDEEPQIEPGPGPIKNQPTPDAPSKKVFTLPQTGEASTFNLSLVGIIMIGTLVLFWRKSKKRSSATKLLIIGLIVGSAYMSQGVVFADQNVNSETDVMFKANNSVIPPVDPEGEGGIVPTHPATTGPLSINYGSNVAFGSRKKTRRTQTFYANDDVIKKVSGEEEVIPNFVQVTDLRGTGSGWRLSVRQNSPFTNAKGESLKAQMTLAAVSVASPYGTANQPEGLASQELVPGSLHEIVKAEAGTGLGTWNIYLGNLKDDSQNISLTVPNNQPKVKGKYSTTLTWFLQDVL